MKFISLTKSMQEQWNQIVLNSDEACVFHVSQWMDLTERNWDLESKSFLIEYEGKSVGVCPLQLNRKSKSLKSTYLGLGGVILINGLQDGVKKKVLKASFEYIKQIALEAHSPYIEVYLSAISPSSLNNHWQINPLIHYSYDDISSQTYIIDLNKPIEQIYQAFTDDARASIRKAIEEGYTIESFNHPSDINELYEIHCENRKRTNVETHPKEFFEGFYQQFCLSNLAVIWKAKDKTGKIVAFEVTGLFSHAANYWMGSCHTDHLQSGINYFLQYHAIQWAKNKGALWYESGEAFPNSQDSKLKGLTLFKSKFGGQLHRLYKGRITITPFKNSNLIDKALNKFKRILKRR